ncbi:hypothetical protein B484DRAFT_55089 [Ochromonadaceae sp. CCMP2298]|nr:hypothetical protein B484DRAFT_55089 [Ochromonadaceae sp. CCMP2298]
MMRYGFTVELYKPKPQPKSQPISSQPEIQQKAKTKSQAVGKIKQGNDKESGGGVGASKGDIGSVGKNVYALTGAGAGAALAPALGEVGREADLKGRVCVEVRCCACTLDGSSGAMAEFAAGVVTLTLEGVGMGGGAGSGVLTAAGVRAVPASTSTTAPTTSTASPTPTSRVTHGLGLGLRRLSPGQRALITCAPSAAYGISGNSLVAPNSMVVFDVEILSVGETNPGVGEGGGVGVGVDAGGESHNKSAWAWVGSSSQRSSINSGGGGSGGGGRGSQGSGSSGGWGVPSSHFKTDNGGASIRDMGGGAVRVSLGNQRLSTDSSLDASPRSFMLNDV